MSDTKICQACKKQPATHTFPACLTPGRVEADGMTYRDDAEWVHPEICADCMNVLHDANAILSKIGVPHGELYQVGGFERLND